MNTPHDFNDDTRRGARRKQAIAIAVILLLGTAAGIGILTGVGKSGGAQAEEGHGHGHGHEEVKGHSDDEHHEDGKAGKEGKEGKADAHAHGDEAGKGGKADAHGHGDEAGKGGKAAKAGEAAHADEDEGVIRLTDAQVKAAGIVVEPAASATLQGSFQLPGEVKFNEDRTAHVVPRVTGVVEAVPVSLGQVVRRGELLAVISSPAVSDQRADLQASNKRLQLARATYERERRLYEEKISPQQDVQVAEQALREAEIAVANARQKLQAVGASPESSALNRFELRAPFDGTLVEKHIALGEQVREDTNVFTVSDLRSVWAQISVPAKDLAQVRVGDAVTIRATAFEQSATGKVAYVGALIGEQTRTAQARVALDNPKSAWRPGLFVNVEVRGDRFTVPVSVAADAVQTMADKTVVFVKTAEGFVAQPVRVGRGDGQRVEVVEGLRAGTPVVAVGSFVVKAEAGKASASHSH
ncbi:efflux RND transporter periplasmic adaptor subunit [Mitsuaria sp. GD03876]|uniref:efflux RND transporter periplasmic adaptor subunit n=1 Tax=Mitsuaria sp. GD03876 TaxID=2975399 RepID=UPI0024474B58|nr:efflux RND transporter periplasmic adaptor subunit [Mitsuaria sp. GD03876]MDH0863851.1 efflux RND transporter periplasmic adaptor subunit [Mitsuaria sp. GD03876]